jgi:thymidylate synthase (FAD)
LIDSTIQEKDENGNIIASYIDTQTSNIEKYGEWIEVDGCKYLLTNFRAIVNDFEQYGSRGVDLRNRYNTLEECEIIKEHFKVFNFKVDLPTRSQMVRHRVSWQELSRRYVSGSRVPFEFYVSEKMKPVISVIDIVGADEEFTTQKEPLNHLHIYDLILANLPYALPFVTL